MTNQKQAALNDSDGTYRAPRSDTFQELLQALRGMLDMSNDVRFTHQPSPVGYRSIIVVPNLTVSPALVVYLACSAFTMFLHTPTKQRHYHKSIADSRKVADLCCRDEMRGC